LTYLRRAEGYALDNIIVTLALEDFRKLRKKAELIGLSFIAPIEKEKQDKKETKMDQKVPKQKKKGQPKEKVAPAVKTAYGNYYKETIVVRADEKKDAQVVVAKAS